MEKNYDEPLYLISVVAKVLNIHPQTLRQYEREGLVTPDRTGGKMRLYSQRDIDKIQSILTLTRDMGVNLAGVDVIFKLKEQIFEYERTIDELSERLAKFEGKSTKSSLVKVQKRYDIVFYDDKK